MPIQITFNSSGRTINFVSRDLIKSFGHQEYYPFGSITAFDDNGSVSATLNHRSDTHYEMFRVPFGIFEDAQGNTFASAQDVANYINQDVSGFVSADSSGIEFTGGFAGKPLSNNYVWEAGLGINISQADVDAEIYKTFSLDSTVQAQVDTPYWTDPTPADHTGKGVFGGSYLPEGVTNVFDYTTVDSDTYEDGSNIATTGGFDFSQLQVGDKVEIRFDFNAIPQIANTTLQPAIWYKNRDANDNVTFTFPLTAQPIFYGTGTVGNTYLNRIEMSVYIASQEDINSLSHFAAKSDNPIIIQPLSCLLTIVR